MSKRALKRIKNGDFIKCDVCDEKWNEGCECCIDCLSRSKEIKVIEKDLERLYKLKKVLAIIKIEMPNLTLLASCVDYETYKEKSGDNLTKEEYEILKEEFL